MEVVFCVQVELSIQAEVVWQVAQLDSTLILF